MIVFSSVKFKYCLNKTYKNSLKYTKNAIHIEVVEIKLNLRYSKVIWKSALSKISNQIGNSVGSKDTDGTMYCNT